MHEPLLTRLLQEPHGDADESVDSEDQVATDSPGSSVASAIFNFTNALIGAGCLGLASAMAQSGGLLSVVTLLAFAWLFKLSLDLLIDLSLRHGAETFEGLAQLALGRKGQLGLIVSKFLYSFGCLVAYVVVVKDNLGPAVKSLLFGNDDDDEDQSSLEQLLGNHGVVTWAVGLAILFPLCLLRDMTPLSTFSAISIFGMIIIVGIVIYLYLSPSSDTIRQPGHGTVYEHWFEIRPAYWECLGTFVFTYASQHVVHMAFLSLKPELRTLDNWKTISKYSVGLAAVVSTTVAVFVYMTFWESTESDIFDLYPGIPLVNLAKLLLCLTLLLTFPLPFFTCRELFLVLITTLQREECASEHVDDDKEEDDDYNDDSVRLIETTPNRHKNADVLELESYSMDGSASLHRSQTRHVRVSIFHDMSVFRPPCVGPAASGEVQRDEEVSAVESAVAPSLGGWKTHVFRQPLQELQLKTPFHVAWTASMWFVVTYLAIAAPNLGDVLNVVGCASGTMIAFFFPGTIAYMLDGYSWKMALIFGTGLIIAPIGTFYSAKKLIEDLL